VQRILSTYRFINQPLGSAMLGEIAAAGFSGVEVFCAPQHFSYRDSQAIRELGDALGEHHLRLHSLHSPTERDLAPGRESGVPISISDPERIRRLDAVDEIKRALDVAEKVPFQYLVQHIGHGRQTADPRKLDAAFTSLENLSMFAKARGVTITLENTPDELGAPSSLQLCFDIGHAHVEDGVTPGLEAMRERVVTAHIHDNHGDKDEHLLPFDGTIDWDVALRAIVLAAQPVPFVFEIKAQGTAGPTLEQIRAACDKLEEKFDSPGTGAAGP
jgi:sugar phosphate isomerase/epimerase